MKKGIDNGLLLGDLDCKKFAIKNPGSILPFPSNLVGTNDSRLTDQRTPLDGSVTNSSVNAQAAIGQSKLNFSGTLPSGFLGTTMWTAAQGDLYQPKSQKDQHNGYPSLDANGRMPNGSIPTAGTGTVKQVGLSFPSEFLIDNPIQTHGSITFNVTYAATAPAFSWFGNVSGASGRPTFGANLFRVSMIPNLPASKITTGQIDEEFIPVAKHGTGHIQGLVPDPEPQPGTGQPMDYLARDMTFKTMSNPIAYQPMIPDPAIVFLSFSGTNAYVTITNVISGASLFYSLNSGTGDNNPFVEFTGPFLIAQGGLVRAYASKAGYNDSNIVTYQIPNV